MEIRVPFYANFQALTHVQHRHFFSYGTLDLITEKSAETYAPNLWKYKERKLVFKRGAVSSKIKSKSKIDIFYPLRLIFAQISNKFPSLYQESFLVYLYPASEVIYEIEPIK